MTYIIGPLSNWHIWTKKKRIRNPILVFNTSNHQLLNQ